MSRHHVLDLAGGSSKISNDFTDFVRFHRIQEYKSLFYLKISSKVDISDEDLAEASNKPRARRSKARKAKEQRPISPIRCLTETGPNDASSQDSQVPQEVATTNAGDAHIPVEKVSSRARRSKARKKAKQKQQQLHHASQQAPDSPSTRSAPKFERAEVSQASIPIGNTLNHISTCLRLLESIMEQWIHKRLSNVLGVPRFAAKALKKQRSWEQVRGDYEQAEMVQDLNQQLKQEMQSLDIPGNQASEEDTLYD
ncbi:unnamed protein product [Arabidopsis halleri]